MKLLRISIVILLLAGISSCKKKEYPDSIVNNETVFYFKGQIGDSLVKIGAGLSDYYMYSSYEQDQSGVYNFNGNLKQVGCIGHCPRSLSIQIRDMQAVLAGAPASGAVFLQPNLPFNAPGYEVSFNYSYNLPASSIVWDFGDGNTSGSAQHLYKKGGNYRVRLSITSSGGCVSSITNTVKLGTPDSACRTSISTASGGNKTLNFSQVSSGQQPITSYLWEFGDGQRSTLPNPSHTYKNAGGYPVSLRVTDAGGLTAYASYNAIVQPDGSSCAANFSIGNISRTGSVGLGSVLLTWTDAQGTEYSSDRVTQPADSYCQIVSVEDYGTNERGEKTKRVHLKVKCDLGNGSNSLTLDNADAVICVAYK